MTVFKFMELIAPHLGTRYTLKYTTIYADGKFNYLDPDGNSAFIQSHDTIRICFSDSKVIHIDLSKEPWYIAPNPPQYVSSH